MFLRLEVAGLHSAHLRLFEDTPGHDPIFNRVSNEAVVSHASRKLIVPVCTAQQHGSRQYTPSTTTSPLLLSAILRRNMMSSSSSSGSSCNRYRRQPTRTLQAASTYQRGDSRVEDPPPYCVARASGKRASFRLSGGCS